jgi:hypothetical protein
MATKGTGPAHSLVNGKAVYETEALDEWLADQLAAKRPAAKNRPRPACPGVA